MLELRRVREGRGLSLTDVCRMTGIAPTTLSEIERSMRHVYPGWRKRIAEAFELPESKLFREVENDTGK
jgi:transcriptional regulator with XRE-family HTH domain